MGNEDNEKEHIFIVHGEKTAIKKKKNVLARSSVFLSIFVCVYVCVFSESFCSLFLRVRTCMPISLDSSWSAKQNKKKKGLSPFRHDGQSKISLHATIRSGGEGFRQENTLKKKKNGVHCNLLRRCCSCCLFSSPHHCTNPEARERKKKRRKRKCKAHNMTLWRKQPAQHTKLQLKPTL